MSTLLAVGCHPDDLSIFFGGTLARYADEGWTVIGVTVDEGRGSPHSFEMDPDTLVATRSRELAWEASRLGYRLEHFALPGVKTDETRAAALERLVDLILADPPELVITHNLADAHASHVAVAQLALRALLVAKEREPRLVLPEVWQGDGWEPVHYPNVRVDVTQYMNIKMAAISQHASQIYDTPYLMGAWGLNLYRAGFASSHTVTDAAVVFAEAYRSIAPGDLASVVASFSPAA